MIKLAHTLFALPFALSALCLASIEGYTLGWAKILWTILAFSAARSAAMGFNRIADRKFDAINPRTKSRPTVNGEISVAEAFVFTGVSAALFVFSAAMLNPLCLLLSFPALAVLFGYSYAKRFTAASHYILGVSLALAPAGAWIAATGYFDARILSVSFALFFNIAAFDIIYALQDLDFDRKNGLHSVPAKFGRRAALCIAALSFAAAAGCLYCAGPLYGLGAAYNACVAVIAFLYAAGMAAVSIRGEDKTQLVFFYENASISILMFFGIATNLL